MGELKRSRREAERIVSTLVTDMLLRVGALAHVNVDETMGDLRIDSLADLYAELDAGGGVEEEVYDFIVGPEAASALEELGHAYLRALRALAAEHESLT